MIGPQDLDEYYKLLDELQKQSPSGEKALLQEQQDLLTEQIWLNKRLLALQMKLMGFKW